MTTENGEEKVERESDRMKEMGRQKKIRRKMKNGYRKGKG